VFSLLFARIRVISESIERHFRVMRFV